MSSATAKTLVGSADAQVADRGLSVVIPVYGNAGSIADLLARLRAITPQLRGFEAVFVVDASPDDSRAILERELPKQPFPSQLLVHARNFGSFAAIRSGLAVARGARCAVMAADLQEPPELLIEFDEALLRPGVDVAVGVRRSRGGDSLLQRVPSNIFWAVYRRVVQPDIPRGGVDVFACSARFRDELLRLGESNSSLVGQLFWLGFERVEVPYDRLPRQHGTSGWTFRRKLRYLTDSVFAFTDLPIRLVTAFGAVGTGVSLAVATIVVAARVLGLIDVPGYAAIILAITFFGALNVLTLGIVGSYLWRTFENTKGRPGAVVSSAVQIEPVDVG